MNVGCSMSTLVSVNRTQIVPFLMLSFCAFVLFGIYTCLDVTLCVSMCNLHYLLGYIGCCGPQVEMTGPDQGRDEFTPIGG